MEISIEELKAIAEDLGIVVNEIYEDTESVGLYREVQRLSKDWKMDFLIGVLIGANL